MMMATIPGLRGSMMMFLGAAVALFFGLGASPAYAHCKGKHQPPHEHCIIEPPTEPPAAFNPEIVYKTTNKKGQRRQIVVANSDPDNPIITVVHETNFRSTNSVSWHPNGAEILFTQVVDDQWGIYRLKLFELDNNDVRILESFNPGIPERIMPIIDDFGLSTQARWSPVPIDGKYWIAYNDVIIPGSNDHDIFLIDEYGDNKTQLTHTQIPSDDDVAESYPTWSPDATRIAVRTFPTNGFASPSDIEILYLGLECDGKPICVVDRVSLLLGNGEIDPVTEAAALVNLTNADSSQLTIGSLDWSNSGHKLVARSSHSEPNFASVMLWTVPTSDGSVPTDVEKTTLQQGVNGTVILMEDSVIGRISPVWSPDDKALLYRFVWYDDRGPNTCDRSTDTRRGDLRPGSIVIGVANSGVGDTDPETIQCADEENQIGFGFGINLEWWRGGVGFNPLVP